AAFTYSARTRGKPRSLATAVEREAEELNAVPHEAEPPFIVDDSRAPIPADIAPQLSDLVAADRRNYAVPPLPLPDGAPRIVMALMRLLQVWPKLTRVVGGCTGVFRRHTPVSRVGSVPRR